MNEAPQLTYGLVGNGTKSGKGILGMDPGVANDQCMIVGFKYEPGAFSSHDVLTAPQVPRPGVGVLDVVERRFVKQAHKPLGSMRQRKRQKGRMLSYTVEFFPNRRRRDSSPVEYIGENLISVRSVDLEFLRRIHQSESRKE